MVPTDPSHAPPRRSSRPAAPKPRRQLLVWCLLLGGVVVLGLVILLIIVGQRLANELKKADPISGVTIDVDTGNSVEPKRIDHAARAYLQRRLRAAGFDQAGLAPLRVAVVFKKIGEVQYKTSTEVVSGDKVRLEITFYDQTGKQLKTVSAEPKMHSREEFKFHAETELNKTAYSRAVSQILKMELPLPTELGLTE